MKLDRIVLSTDLSPASLEALKPALALDPTGSAKITVVTVVEEFSAAPHGAPLAPPITPVDNEVLKRDAQAALEAWCRENGSEAECVVVTATDVSRSVIEFAEERDADLLVLATHGRTGFRHLVLGSVAEAILRGSRCPVLVFPQPKKN